MAKTGRVDVQAVAAQCLASVFSIVSELPPEDSRKVCSRILAAMLESSKDIPKAVALDDEPGLVPVAELTNAYCWECPRCQADNFEYSVCTPLTHAEQRDIAIKLGLIEDWQEWDDDINLVRTDAPGESTCATCGLAIVCAYQNTLNDELIVGGQVVEEEDDEDG